MFVRRIAVIDSGYVGLTTGACLASLGHRVVCADLDDAKGRGCPGEVSILEPGLPELVAEGLAAGRLRFVVGAAAAVGHAPDARQRGDGQIRSELLPGDEAVLCQRRRRAVRATRG
jgi:UDPglucose 6-dehydrogenase